MRTTRTRPQRDTQRGAAKRPSLGLFQFVGLKDVALFSRQLAVMIDAGVPVVQALEILERQFGKKAMAKVLRHVRTTVEAGSSLSEAMGRWRNIFGEFLISMVAVGETGGVLGFTLNRVAEYLEKLMALRGKVRSAMIYPLVIFLVAVGATIFLLVAVIPTFAQICATFDAELPLPTRIVIGISNFIPTNGLLLLLGLIGAAILGYYVFRKNEKGRYFSDNVFLHTPVIGNVLRKSSISRFSRTLGVLIKGGVPIMEALEITARTSGNRVVEKAVLEARRSISEGKNISEPLEKSRVFPPLVTQLIAVGETTGDLPGMLDKLADFYDMEVDNAVNTMTSVLEPIMLIFMGVIVGGILISLYLPIFSISSVIK